MTTVFLVFACFWTANVVWMALREFLHEAIYTDTTWQYAALISTMCWGFYATLSA